MPLSTVALYKQKYVVLHEIYSQLIHPSAHNLQCSLGKLSYFYVYVGIMTLAESLPSTVGR